VILLMKTWQRYVL